MTCVRAAPDRRRDLTPCCKSEFVPGFILSILAAARLLLRDGSDTALEILALRQPVAVLQRKSPRAPLNCFDRLFRTTPSHFGTRWRDVLVIVKPETVAAWQRAGVRL